MALSSTDMITLRNQDQSPLLRLPGELRNKIYGYALGGSDICIEAGYKLWFSHKSSDRSSVSCREGPGIKWHRPQHIASLTRVCRQTCVEGRPLLFGMNEFGGNECQMLVALPDLFPDGEIRDLRKTIRVCTYFENLRLYANFSVIWISPETFWIMEALATGSQLRCIVVELPWRLRKDLEEHMIASWKAKLEESESWQVLKANNVKVRVIGKSDSTVWF